MSHYKSFTFWCEDIAHFLMTLTERPRTNATIIAAIIWFSLLAGLVLGSVNFLADFTIVGVLGAAGFGASMVEPGKREELAPNKLCRVLHGVLYAPYVILGMAIFVSGTVFPVLAVMLIVAALALPLIWFIATATISAKIIVIVVIALALSGATYAATQCYRSNSTR